MLINPTEEQEFFRATTERFLLEHAPPDAVRHLRDDADGFDRAYWRRGAELGWTSLLVDEAHGGGSISGAGLVDLSLVAYEFGHHAAPGPLTATNVVASALSDHGTDGEQAEVLAGLLSGETIATWCAPELGAGQASGAPASRSSAPATPWCCAVRSGRWSTPASPTISS